MSKKSSPVEKSENDDKNGLKTIFTNLAREDYEYWAKKDPDTLVRINRLINNALKTPRSGIGKPKSLKGDLSGYISRRINQNDRLVYRPVENGIEIIQCRYHY